jgi:large subunit ribosomal protein L15
MKLHDLRPAEGSRTPKIRVGRGIAAGKGKTAGRGTKGQKSRAGGSIPPWFEGGQTPLHMRIPKLRGFRNRGRIEYEVVNVGDIGRLAARGTFQGDDTPKGRGAKAGPSTVNQDILREAGLVRTLAKPLKVLGHGDLETPLFVVADAFSRSAVTKIEAAGGTVSVLEKPKGPLAAIGVETAPDAPASAPEAPAAETAEVTTEATAEAPAAESASAEPTTDQRAPTRRSKPTGTRSRAGSRARAEDAAPADDAASAQAEPNPEAAEAESPPPPDEA